MNDELPAPRSAPDDAPLDAAAMLRLVEGQQREVQRRMGALAPGILLAWGIAWLVGFGMLWLIDGAPDVVAVPLVLAVVAFIALQCAALATSAILGVRMGRGIRSTPRTTFTGTVFGFIWPAGFVGIWGIATALVRAGMPPELLNLYYPAASVLFVGIMYVVAGAIWQAVPSIVMGAMMVLLAVVAPQFGYPTHYLIFSVAGGGLFLLGAVLGVVLRRDPTGGWGGWGR